MQCPTLAELSPAPSNRVGWPWTEQSESLSECMSDGKPWPKVSIVTPSYNQGRFIEETIRSVLLQNYPNLEYIIIDGGSTDDSVEIIKKYSPWLTYWISEPDHGQSHAINKGLKHCTGDIFNWINSDDFLCPGTLTAVAAAWNKTPNVIIAGGGVKFKQDGTETITKSNAMTLENYMNIRKARENSWAWLQPSTYLPLAEVKSIGGVREDLHLVMDHFLMVGLLQKCNVVYIPEVLIRFRLHDESKSVILGWHNFLLEILKTLSASNDFEKYVTANELKEEMVSSLISYGAMARRERLYGFAFKHISKAIFISPRLVMLDLLQRDFFRRLLRKLGRMFMGW